MTTKNIIPQADGEGSIGIDGTSWASGVFNTGVFEEILVGGSSVVLSSDFGTVLNNYVSKSEISIDANENVGIGTANPGSAAGGNSLINPITNFAGKLLHIEKENGNANLIIGSSIQPGIAFAEGDASADEGYKLLRVNTGDIQFVNLNDGGTIKNIPLNIKSNGDVGIGTTSPGKKLHVAGNSHQIVIEDTDAVAGEKMRGIYNNNQKLYIGRYTDDLNSFYDDMVIDFTGKVGIGTTDPGAKLSVVETSGGTQFEVRGTSAIGGQFQINNAGGDIYANYRGAGSNDDVVKIDTNGDSFFNGGNVGIGTTSPAAKLDIDGDISISGAIVSSDSNGRVLFSDQGLMVGQAEVKPDPDNPQSLYFQAIPQVKDSEGNAVTVLTADKLGLGTSASLTGIDDDIKFKLLTDQQRFVVGTTGEYGLGSGWYRFNDFKVKGATDIGAHPINPVDTRIYSDESSFILFKTDTAGNRVAHLVGGEEEVSPNNAIALGIAVKVDSSELPQDIEFVHTDGESYSVINGNSDSLGTNGLPIRQGFQSPSLGSAPAPLLIDGGSF